MTLAGSNLYAGGTFTTVQSEPHLYLAGITPGDVVGVPDQPMTQVTLENRPNPFHRSTLFHFSLPRAAEVSLAISDLGGREISRPADRLRLPAGPNDLRWDASRLPSRRLRLLAARGRRGGEAEARFAALESSRAR